jgi:HSP20 family molecular chaperone IbpA
MTRTAQSNGDDTRTGWSEFIRDDVYRCLDLQDAIDVDKATATLTNGLLTVEAIRMSPPKRSASLAPAA